MDRGGKVPSSNCSVSDILDLKPELNSLKSLKEPLASSNSEGMIDGEDLLEDLLTFSKVLLSLLLVELDISVNISIEGTSLNNSIQT